MGIIITPLLGLLGLGLDTVLRLCRQIRHALKSALGVAVHRIPVDAIRCTFRVARRGVLHLGRRSDYEEKHISVQ